jgi:protein-tyrosine phosphatase
MSASGQFEIVFVCTGNRARSALAEALLRRRLRPDSAAVRSVGTLDLGPDVPALPGAVHAAALFGEDLSGHRARTLRRGELADVDLVIGFEPAHISAAIVDGEAARDRTFSIVELADLLEESASAGTADRPHEAVERAAAHRTGSFLAAPEISDPLGGSERVFRETALAIDHLVDRIARGLFHSTTKSATRRTEPDPS